MQTVNNISSVKLDYFFFFFFSSCISNKCEVRNFWTFFQLGRTVKVRLQTLTFKWLTIAVNRCGYACAWIKHMEPGSCHVACNGNISDYSTRIRISLGLSPFIYHYSVKQRKDLLFCELIILENVLNNSHELQPSLKCNFAWIKSEISFCYRRLRVIFHEYQQRALI